MMLDAIDVNLFPVSPAMFLREDRSWVACQDKHNNALMQLSQGDNIILPNCYLEWYSVDQIWSTEIHARIVCWMAK
jgi:hypothetical protein